jgi:hypothetical protein
MCRRADRHQRSWSVGLRLEHWPLSIHIEKETIVALTNTESGGPHVDIHDADDTKRPLDGQSSEGAATVTETRTEAPITYGTPAKMAAKRIGVSPTGVLSLTGNQLTGASGKSMQLWGGGQDRAGGGVDDDDVAPR